MNKIHYFSTKRAKTAPPRGELNQPDDYKSFKIIQMSPQVSSVIKYMTKIIEFILDDINDIIKYNVM